MREGELAQRTSLRNLDIYAFIDSDTNEAKAFTTYLGYWDCLAVLIRRLYGDQPFQGILMELQHRPAFRKLAGRRYTGPEDALTSRLLNAWNSELGLYLADDGAKLQAANQWSSVYAYYGTSSAALAWLQVRDGQIPEGHRPLLNALAAQACSTKLLPIPWCLGCTELRPRSFHGFPSAPRVCSNLASAADPFDRVGMMLAATRERRIEQLLEEQKRRDRRNRARHGERNTIDGRTDPTTVFDFLWRTRTRANYGNPGMFYMGTLTPDRSRQYVESARLFTAATMFLFEALVAQRARRILLDSAVHFISRDRSRITEHVLLPRLQALGMKT